MNLDELRSSITAEGLRWAAEDTEFAALPSEQKGRRLGAVPPAGSLSLGEREQRAAARHHLDSVIVGPAAAGPTAPAAVDWRNKDGQNWVTPIEDQGGCGSCVAFGSIASFETHVRIARGQPTVQVDLSEADLWFCYGPSHGAGACPGGGWWPDSAYPGLIAGVVDAACFPYTAADQPCNRCSDAGSRLTKITGWHAITNIADMKSFLAVSGPLTSCFTVYDDFYSYSGGIYAHSTAPSNQIVGGHCICVVGYDDSNQCWICKNSWGSSFGEGGFFRIRYGDCGIDAEMWAIDGVVADTGWSSWAGLRGGLTSDPEVGSNADGRLELFARGTDNALYHIWQSTPNGSWSGRWAGLGGGLTSRVAVGRNADGRLEVFVRGTDNALYHAWQNTPNGNWSGWAALGSALSSDPAVASNADGRLEVFVRGSNNLVYHTWQSAPNGNWSGWAGLGGGAVTSNIAVGRNADGRLGVFVRGADNALHHAWQSAPNGNWSGWAGLGGGLIGNIAVGRNADGRLEVFVRGTDNGLYHIWQSAPNDNWSGWVGLGGALASDPAVAANADGHLEVFIRGTDNALQHIWQTAPNGNWSSWAGLGGGLIGNITVGRNADGRLEVFVRGTDNGLYHIWQI